MEHYATVEIPNGTRFSAPGATTARAASRALDLADHPDARFVETETATIMAINGQILRRPMRKG